MILAAFLSIAIAACAGDSLEDVDTGDQDAQLDSGAADAAGDIGDAADLPVDASGDVGANAGDAHEDACGVCCPDQRTCLDDNRAGVCSADGSEFVEEVCADTETCEEGSCVPVQICQEGETQCYDSDSRLICRPGGTAWRTEECAAGTACVGGECVSGAANGTTCSDASECAGGKCRCGAGESCTAVPPGAESKTYCTATCTPGSCGPGQICVSAQDFGAAGYDHCLPICNEVCALEGMACVHVPTRDSGELTFEQACFPDDAVEIGRECTSDRWCAGGTCLRDYFDIALCTAECSGNCPDGTACVELEAGAFHCSPLCGDGTPGTSDPCPLEGGEDIFSIGCAPKTTFGGGVKEVCVSTGS
jgi:hypothetical protein